MGETSAAPLRNRWVAWTLVLALGALVLGCGGAGAVGASDAHLHDDERQRGRALTLLAAGLKQPGTARAALTELRMLGQPGVPWLQHMLGQAGLTDPTRLELLCALGGYADEAARSQLDRSAERDAVARACSLRWQDDDAVEAQLSAHLGHVSSRVRAAALRRARGLSWSSAQQTQVQDLARRDPEPEVRALAIEALVAQRVLDAATLQTHLEDPDAGVRAVAMRALADLDCVQAHTRLAERLSGPPSREALAAVRALARCPAHVLEATLDALQRALATQDTAIRAEAAITADALRWMQVPAWLEQALEHDPTPAVRLSLAIALHRSHPDRARRVMRSLSQSADGMVKAQAAIALHDAGDTSARTLLLALRTAAEPQVRAVVYRALGRAGGGADVARGMDDSDVQVRLAAAGAWLRGDR